MDNNKLNMVFSIIKISVWGAFLLGIASLFMENQMVKQQQGNNHMVKQKQGNKKDDKLAFVNKRDDGKRDSMTPRLPCCSPNSTRCSWHKSKVEQKFIPECEKENLLSILNFLDDVLTSNGIRWMITAGTLLGSIRERGHIRHETDIDIEVPYDDLALVRQLINSKINSTHFVYKPNMWGNRDVIDFSKTNQLHIDIWWYMHINENNSTREIMPNKNNFVWYLVDDSILFPLSKCVYENRMYPCPNQSERYLELRYGNDWNISKPKYGPKKFVTYKDGDDAGFIAGKGIPEWKHSCSSIAGGLANKNFNKLRGNKLNILKDVVGILSRLDCPYHIMGPTLYNFVKSCDLPTDLLRFAIPFDWWQQPSNRNSLKDALAGAGNGTDGYSLDFALGEKGSVEYREIWIKGKVRIELVTIVEKDSFFEWTQWILPTTGNMKTATVSTSCATSRDSVGKFDWDNTTLRAPTPFDTVLNSDYGTYWRNLNANTHNYTSCK